MKKILISLTVVALVAPQMALAAWWNPFSWFKKQIPPQAQAVRIEDKKTTATSTAPEVEKLKKEISELKKQQSSPVSMSTLNKSGGNILTESQQVGAKSVTTNTPIKMTRAEYQAKYGLATNVPPETNYRDQLQVLLSDKLKALNSEIFKFNLLYLMPTNDEVERINGNLSWIEGYGISNPAAGEFLKDAVNIQLNWANAKKIAEENKITWLKKYKAAIEEEIVIFTNPDYVVTKNDMDALLADFKKIDDEDIKLYENQKWWDDESSKLDKKVEGFLAGKASVGTNVTQQVVTPSYPPTYNPFIPKLSCESTTDLGGRTFTNCR